MAAKFLSIVTPTYNRGHLLPNCYASLRNQSDLDFEWIIVDDGSQDDTSSVVKTFSQDLFPIRYLFQENGGKHTALNAATPYLQGTYLLILDSDDTLTPDAVSSIRTGWEPFTSQESIAMLLFLKGSDNNHPLCKGPVSNKPLDILRHKRRIFQGSDCCEVIRTAVWNRFPFPVFEGERFLSECALWNRVAETYKCAYIHKVIYLCRYLEDGLTKSGRKLRISNPKGGMYICKLRMVPKNYLLQRIKYSLLYCCYGYFAGHKARRILMRNPYKLLTALCLLPGWFLYGYWKQKYR